MVVCSLSFSDSRDFLIQYFLLLYTQNMFLDCLCQLIILYGFKLLNNYFSIVGDVQIRVCFYCLFQYLRV